MGREERIGRRAAGIARADRPIAELDRWTSMTATRPAYLVALLLTGLFCACAYYSTGGGMPSHIRSVGVEFFENTTVETGLEEQMTRSLSDLLLSQSQFRYGSARSADAVIRGSIVDFLDEPLTYAGGQVSQNQVTVRVDAEVWDRVKRKTLLKREGIRGQGTYDPSGGLVGRQAAFREAFREVSQTIVDAMTSSW